MRSSKSSPVLPFSATAIAATPDMICCLYAAWLPSPKLMTPPWLPLPDDANGPSSSPNRFSLKLSAACAQLGRGAMQRILINTR